MEIKELKKLLQQPYKTDNWKELLTHVFDHVQFLSVPQIVPNDDDRIKELKQYGTVQLSDNKNLALFELTLNDNVNLIRNRVGLNEVVKKYIDQDSFHGILSVFEQGKEDYRFTFTARDTEFDEDEGFIDKDTDTKRFTYILGKNESCRTAAERFDQLSKIEEKNLKAVEDAFNVEKLSKSFFNDYVKEFDKLVAYIKSKPTYYQAVFEKEESAARNYVKKFMGRLVFLKFIQKKGWLGVSVKEKGWKNGDFSFLENQYKNCETKSLFVSQFLNPLFYEALNVGNRKNDEFQQRGYKIPYLSGGLFENENPKDNRVDFDEQELNSLFDFFERYNFTIDENDVNDKEVGIDPEMLGHIFENLLEDNKDKGAFYTPKEIVRYMCQESLKEYLKTYLEKAKQWPEDTQQAEELDKQLSAFVEKKETAKMSRYDVAMATALRDVKICDPAIGSGAFPMGLLNEIFMLIKELHHESPDTVGDIWKMKGKTFEANTVKLNIIQNSIYGVDIEPGAVDIARLRFWLSLIIEEDEPKPLPHLDYKIVVGNSLVSKLDDTIIDIDWELTENTSQTNIFGNEHLERRKEILKQITAKQKEVFKPNSQEEQLSLEIRNLKIDLISNQLELMIKTDGLETQPSPRDKKQKQLTEKWLQTKAWKNQINRLTRLKQTENDLAFFDWKLDFPEVMNPEINDNIGFDIVIGNPPYVRQERLNQVLKESLKKRFPLVANGTADSYVYFFNLGLELTKKNATLIFITLNKFLKTKYGVELRNMLTKSYNVDLVIDFFELPVFQASTDSSITKIFNSENKLNTRYYPVYTLNNLNLFKITSGKHLKVLKENEEWKFIKIGQEKVLKKIYNETVSLKEFTDNGTHYGIKTGCNDIFIINEDKKNGIIENDPKSKEHIHKYIEPKKIGKWEVKKTNKYIIGTFPSLKLEIDNLPGLKRYLSNYRVRLEPKPKGFEGDWNGRKKGSYKWFETQDNVKYSDLFFRPKLIYIHTAKNHSFYYDEESYFVNNSCYLISNDSSFLFSFLNSKLFEWFKKIKFVAYGDASNSGRVKLDYNKMITVPIKKINNKIENKFVTLVKEGKKTNNDGRLEIDNEIDNLIYKLYNLSYEEALIVEPELAERLSKEAYNALEI